ncbi:DNA replication/repair protein RecF [Lichenifustis flavocetrariae]|uniref:DNA replication and repair protein RecF n=1 Tax=Lichenifustis flavocetrariae TaxID=2949735 RepID=A0AA42CLY7_9HYPH|nr:DNA replication/repair protein RecF [Lichenifustis flavocetrariae]MCW6507877.1 DNA replication/repair protein RecF [Lichenifustis flavocetrariae]
MSPPRAHLLPRIAQLKLTDFRSYPSLDLAFENPMVVLTGDNGAGKTNILEAISLLAPGRGLRRAEMAECARSGGHGGWAVAAAITHADSGSSDDPVRLGTGVEPPESGRKCRIERAPVASARAFAEHLRIVWLTPSMDGLFSGPAAERRRFLDRLVLTIDADHASRVAALDRALRNRNRILEDGRQTGLDRAWAEAAEHEVATLGVAVAAARHETVARLANLIAAERDDASPFPWSALALTGEIESLVAQGPALEAEDRYRDLLRANRSRDMAAGRTTVGPHLSDLLVRHGPKDIAAERASTGEQKALLVGLVLAQAHLVAAMSGMAPTLLLDEVAAHFDPSRRDALFGRLMEIGGQVFMTGADPGAFAGLQGPVSTFVVTPGQAVAA